MPQNPQRVSRQIGRWDGDLYSAWSLSDQVLRKMREHNLFEKFGLSYTDCMSMPADEWQTLVKNLDEPIVKRNPSSLEIIAMAIQKIEAIFSGFFGPKKPGKE